jgi:hypothetical protein
MTLPLVVLAFCSFTVGAYFEWTGGFAEFLARTPSLAYQGMAAHGEHDAGAHALVATVSTVLALAGIGLAAFLYLGDPAQVMPLRRLLMPLYLLSYGKMFFDPIYNAVRLVAAGSWRSSYWFDRSVIDGLKPRRPHAAGGRQRLKIVAKRHGAILCGSDGVGRDRASDHALGLAGPGVELEIISGEMHLGSDAGTVTGHDFHPLRRGGVGVGLCALWPLRRPTKRPGHGDFDLGNDGRPARKLRCRERAYAASSFSWLGESSAIDIRFAVRSTA